MPVRESDDSDDQVPYEEGAPRKKMKIGSCFSQSDAEGAGLSAPLSNKTEERL
jgi:hypothetical protein